MKILFITAFIVFGHGLAYAQFDPNCYYPKIGTEIDTIYGSKNEQQPGSYMMSLHRLPDEGYNRTRIYWFPVHENNSQTFKTGPDFNLRNLDGIKQFGLPDIGKGAGKIIKYGHFRSPRYLDMLVFNQDTRFDTIFWADENGSYDTARYTTFNFTKQGKYGYFQSLLYPSYTGYFTSDTVEDIVTGGTVLYTDFREDDTSYLLLYKGGETLFQKGKIAYPDSAISLGNVRFPETTSFIVEGDFRGTGRKDVITYTQNSNRQFDLFF